MEPQQVQSENQPVLDYAPPPTAPRRTITKYVTASIGASVVFVAMTMLMVAVVGQSLDNLKGWQNICAAIAIYGIPAAAGISSFRASLKATSRG
jgi:hypothetical protein